MKLRRVEAVRYGRLAGSALGELGDGLTVVLGPNEAGKSTYTSLVRHVLYGFPTQRDKEVGYFSGAGGRRGRLVFDESGATWVVERSEGPHGGPVAVRSPDGGERPGLLAEITRGVSPVAYRTVFGFGLSELAHIDELRGTDDDIMSVLNPVLAGLGVDPLQVRAAVDKSADEIHAPRASTRLLNKTVSQIGEVRRRLRELEDEASAFAGEQARLRELESQVDAVRRKRDDASLLDRELDRAARDLDAATREANESARAILAQQVEVGALRERLGALVPDALVLAVSAELDALLADLSAHQERMERIRRAAGTLAQMDRAIASSQAALGVSRVDAVDTTPDATTQVASWRDRLSRARSLSETSARAAADAVAASRAAGMAGPVATRSGSLPAYTMIAFGALATGAGIYLGQWPVWSLGILLAVAGIAFALTSRFGRGSAPVTAELSESARLAAQRARSDAEAQSALRAEWERWVAERGLGTAGGEPAGVAEYLVAARELKGAAAERDARLAETEAEHEIARDYAMRLSVAVRGFIPDASECSAETAAVFAERAREALAQARRVEGERDMASESLRAAETRLRELQDRNARATATAASVASAFGCDASGLAELQGLAARASGQAAEAARRYEALAEEKAGLEARLGAEARDSAMGSARLELTGLAERLASQVADHAVLATASRLLSRTQERYEREHQPDVVRAAEQVFQGITGGRFTRLAVPLGGGGIEVYSSSGETFETPGLSRGTAEALYLALRVGLIERLGEAGASLPVLMDDILANFDPERREGAARAIARLATIRQVVFFTCHPATVEALSVACPTRTLLALERCPA